MGRTADLDRAQAEQYQRSFFKFEKAYFTKLMEQIQTRADGA